MRQRLLVKRLVDWRLLSKQEQEDIDQELRLRANELLDFDDLIGILEEIHKGNYCAECWRIYYNCLCSHED